MGRTRFGGRLLDDNVLVQGELLAVEDLTSAKVKAILEIVLFGGGLGLWRWCLGTGLGTTKW